MTEENEAHVDIRRFQPGDGEEIRELNEAALATISEDMPDLPDEDLHDIQHHYDKNGELLVGIANGDIVAMGAFNTAVEWWEEFVDLDSNTAELTRMSVDPEWHRCGIGTSLYQVLEQYARENGYTQFILDTGAVNDAARGFYRNVGFKLQDEFVVKVEDTIIELVLYRKSLES